MTITEHFQAAMEHAQKLQAERDDIEVRRLALRELNATVMGENQQLRFQLESLGMALNNANNTASDRKAVIYELTAQLGMLGKLFIHCTDEVTKIVASANQLLNGNTKPEAPPTPEDMPDRRREPDEGELIGPLVGKQEEVGEGHIPFVKDVDAHNIPFSPRVRLLSETAIPSPAFLHTDGSTPNRELTTQELGKCTFKERKQYVKDGTIPVHLRR